MRISDWSSDVCSSDLTHLPTVLRGMCYVQHVRARLAAFEELTTELLHLAGQTTSPVVQADAHNVRAFYLFHLGQFQPAHDHFQRAAEILEGSSGLVNATWLGVSVGVFNRSYAGHCDWHLGAPDLALGEARQAIDLARQLAHPFSLAVALAYMAMLHQFRGEPERVREQAEDRKSTRLNSITNAHLVCRLLLEKKNSPITQ